MRVMILLLSVCSFDGHNQAGLSSNTVSNIYRRGNTPSMVTLEALCKALGTTMAQFFLRVI